MTTTLSFLSWLFIAAVLGYFTWATWTGACVCR